MQDYDTPETAENVALRRRWIGAFARADEANLQDILSAFDDGSPFNILRPAESGLVMARAQAGGNGQVFNMGEVTVTRCSVRHARGAVGYGYVAGRHPVRAELAARLDALFQGLSEEQVMPVVADLEAAHRKAARARQAEAADTRVEFFTMARGENE